MPKISVFSNEDDWMQIYVDKTLFYDDHISRFSPDCIPEICAAVGVDIQYEETADYGIDSGKDRSEFINLEGYNTDPPSDDLAP